MLEEATYPCDAGLIAQTEGADALIGMVTGLEAEDCVTPKVDWQRLPRKGCTMMEKVCVDQVNFLAFFWLIGSINVDGHFLACSEVTCMLWVTVQNRFIAFESEYLRPGASFEEGRHFFEPHSTHNIPGYPDNIKVASDFKYSHPVFTQWHVGRHCVLPRLPLLGAQYLRFARLA